MNQGHRGVVELNADLPRAKPMSERGSSALATGEGGRRPLRKFGEFTRSVESMKKRKERLGGVASTIRSSVWSLRGQRYGAAEFRARRGSRRRSMARLRRLLELELGQGVWRSWGAI